MTTQNPAQSKKMSAEAEAIEQKKKTEGKQKKSPDKMSEIDEHISRRFEIKKRLGKGAYGIVWKAIDKKTKEVVAVKKIFDAFRNQTDAQRTFREIIFLQSFRNHPNIIKLHSIHRAHNNRDIYLGFEFMDTDLHNVIKRGNILKDIHKRYIMYQMLRATKYIHSGNVIHRDQKPSNVLIDSSCRVKLADFGLARSVSGLSVGSASGVDGAGDACLTDYVATRWYRAPEILVASKRYTKGIDMWSLGCILGEMLTGKALFPGSSTVNQLERIMRAIPTPSKEDINSVCTGYGSALITNNNNTHTSDGGDHSLPSLSTMLTSGAPDALDLVRKLLIFNPQKRLSAVQALKHDYVAKFHREKDEPSLKYDVIPPLNDDLQLSVDDYRNKLYSLMERGGAGGGVASAPVRSHKQRAILPQKSHKLKLSEGGAIVGARRHSLGSLPLSQTAVQQPQMAPVPAPTPQTSTPPHQQYHPVNHSTGSTIPVPVCSSAPLPATRAIRGSGATYFHSQTVNTSSAPHTIKARVTRTSKLERSAAMSHLQPTMQSNHSQHHGNNTVNGNPRILRSDVKITNGEQRYKNGLNIDYTIGRKELPSKVISDQRMDRLDRFGGGGGEWYGSYYQQCNTKCQGDFKVPSQSHHRQRDENIRDAMRDRPTSTLPYKNSYDQSDCAYDKFGRKSSVVISNAIVNVHSGIR